MGGGLEADLSQGAVPVLWSAPHAAAAGLPRSRPVLQVADVTRVPDGTSLHPAPAPAPVRCRLLLSDGTSLLHPAPAPVRYRLLLSDGVHSQHASLAPTLDHLASGGAIRRGSVVRLVTFGHDPGQEHFRTIFITQLEILQTVCALIGSLKLYKPPRNSGMFNTSRSMSYGLRSDCEPCFGVRRIRYGPSCGSYPSGGDKLSSVALSEKQPVWKLVGQIKDENLGYSDKPDLITVKATISSVNPELLYYLACPLVVNGRRCNAKATRVGDIWRCKSCKYSFLQSSEYGRSVRIQIQDHTGTTSATVCEEAVEEIFGCKGRDLYSLKYKEQDDAQLHDIMVGAVHKQFVFQLKVEGQAPQPVFSKVGIAECIVLKAEKVNPSAECRRLLGQIDTLIQEGSGPGSELRKPTMPTCTGLLDSRVCSSVRRSSNSVNSDYPFSAQLRDSMLQQQLKQQLRISEQRLRGCVVSAGEP